ncbi:MAG: two-component regulator propeller domain-containing protein [Bacteroidota bacterium]
MLEQSCPKYTGQLCYFYTMKVRRCFISYSANWKFLILSLLSISPKLLAQDSFTFHHLTVSDGLSQSTINCLFQDSRGFLWIGTQDGLDKYDGYNFTHYRHVPNDININ